MKISGLLINVDPYLNLCLKEVETAEISLQQMKICSVRGLAIKSIELDIDDKLERLNHGSRLCISDLQKINN